MASLFSTVGNMTENLNKADSDENGPHLAAYAGSMDFMVAFLRADGPVGYSNSAGDTPLHAAADGWQSRMVEFLILSGAGVNAQNKNGDTPLHTLTRSRIIPCKGTFLKDIVPQDAREATFRMLLLRGANTGIKNLQGGSALHLAAWEGDLVALNMLSIASSCLIDDVTTKGVTSLALAILGEHVDCATRLIKMGANINFILPNGERPVDLLRSSGNSALQALCDLSNSDK
jgi:ankyrin repeat protein